MSLMSPSFPQAYVAWVNSQLRKRGRPLISDLRRDLQSGVVFADLIEIICKYSCRQKTNLYSRCWETEKQKHKNKRLTVIIIQVTSSLSHVTEVNK